MARRLRSKVAFIASAAACVRSTSSLRESGPLRSTSTTTERRLPCWIPASALGVVLAPPALLPSGLAAHSAGVVIEA
eukprot:scaffold208199_cov26-Tisochrysis_lutea.AAC.3